MIPKSKLYNFVKRASLRRWEHSAGKGGLPEPPTNCCMSGCTNCVWLDYAEKLMRFYEGQDEKTMKEILDKVEDPNMKAFLSHELRMKLREQKKPS